MGDSRAEVRLLCADIVEISWHDLTSRRRSRQALLEDISPSGACVQLDSPLPVGSEIRLRCHREELTGYVKYCVYREIGYFAGIEFRTDSRWSPEAFQPEHLLNPATLCRAAGKRGR